MLRASKQSEDSRMLFWVTNVLPLPVFEGQWLVAQCTLEEGKPSRMWSKAPTHSDYTHRYLFSLANFNHFCQETKIQDHYFRGKPVGLWGKTATVTETIPLLAILLDFDCPRQLNHTDDYGAAAADVVKVMLTEGSILVIKWIDPCTLHCLGGWWGKICVVNIVRSPFTTDLLWDAEDKFTPSVVTLSNLGTVRKWRSIKVCRRKFSSGVRNEWSTTPLLRHLLLLLLHLLLLREIPGFPFAHIVTGFAHNANAQVAGNCGIWTQHPIIGKIKFNKECQRSLWASWRREKFWPKRLQLERQI